MIKRFIRKFLSRMENVVGNNELYDLMLHKQFLDRQASHCNPLNKSKLFGFAQNEEDGITLEILKRIGLEKGFFIEFGVGNGLENNTIILLASGWKGSWFGGEDIDFDSTGSKKLSFEKVWIKRDNISDLYKSTSNNADVISLDLDGNDIYLVDELLANGAQPKLFIVEYNAKFPPSLEFKITYNEGHRWQSDDYFGASLKTYCKVFEKFGYRLVCCNLTGANAFFVHQSFQKDFSDIPTDIDQLYCEPFYFLRKHKMHPTSPKTIEELIFN